MLLEPSGQTLFLHLAGREFLPDHHALDIRRVQRLSVQRKKEFGDNQRRPFIAVDERMVLADAVVIGQLESLGRP
jgi:hypothetical protein